MATTSIIPGSTVTHLANKDILPLAYSLALKTWFSPQIMQKAHGILQKGKAHHFLFFRHSAALICEDGITAMVNIVKGTRGKHKYVFRDGWCSQCVAGKTGHRCHHVTALAMLCLQENDTTLYPLTMTFADNTWQKIGHYLHQRLTSGPVTITWDDYSGHIRLSVLQESGLSLQVHLHPSAAWELQGLGISGKDDSPAPGKETLTPIVELLTRTTTTQNERALLERGSTSKQLHRDRSCWMWLARLLFLHCPAEDISINLHDSGRFVIHSSGETPLFQLLLPRHHSWELLGQLDLEAYGFQKVQAVEQFNLVEFSDEGNVIVVENWCRHIDGTKHNLADLEDQRFGNWYFMDNCFFTLASLPAEERIHKEQEKTLSLFSLPAQSEEKVTGFRVSSNSIPSFLLRNRLALRAKRHQVATEILELDIVSEPDSLQLTDIHEDLDWCYLAGYYKVGSQHIDLADLLQATTKNQQFIPGRHWFDLRDSPLAWFHNLGSERLTDNGRIKLTRSELLLLGSQVRALDTDIQTKKQGTTLSFLLDREKNDETLPKNIKQNKYLRRYQVNGVQWLYKLQKHGLGGILADDMGLGKTHQALAIIDLLAEKTALFLIVCPVAVLYHWSEKQKSFFPHLSMSIYHGPQRDLNEAMKSRIIVTTYGILRQDISELRLVGFKLVIFDEMHHLKNKQTSIFKAVELLLADAIFGLTGTPVENNIQELETLLTVCLPSLFSSRPVHHIFKDADTREQRQRIQRLIAPFILRRTREQVLLELPERSEDIRQCELSKDQVAAYRQAVEQATGLVDELLGEEPLSDYSHILTTITRLKQICNHLCQLKECTDWTRYHSGKWDEFIRLLRQCLETGLKVVVFSQFTAMLDIMEAWLRTEKIDHISLRGKVAAKERSKRTQRFNTDNKCKVCCASLLAGGTGIDLTGAQVVIHYDRWWNPAKEEQATARVHRMGQRHPVQVYKLVTVGTLEEKIHGLIEQKRALAAELIVEDDGSILKKLSREELAELFRYG